MARWWVMMALARLARPGWVFFFISFYLGDEGSNLLFTRALSAIDGEQTARVQLEINQRNGDFFSSSPSPHHKNTTTTSHSTTSLSSLELWILFLHKISIYMSAARRRSALFARGRKRQNVDDGRRRESPFRDWSLRRKRENKTWMSLRWTID